MRRTTEWSGSERGIEREVYAVNSTISGNKNLALIEKKESQILFIGPKPTIETVCSLDYLK